MLSENKTSKATIRVFESSFFTTVLGLVAFYMLLYLGWYWGTPLGQIPMLDGAENINLAEMIHNSTLPVEPFYRAMLYPWLLSLFFYIGADIDTLIAVASILGIFFHVINAALTGWLAHKVWKTEKALLAGTLLYGLYPVAVYFSADPLDIVPALTFTLLSLCLYVHSSETGSNRFMALSSLSLVIGFFMRPNVLPLAALYLISLFSKQLRKSAIYALLILAAGLCTGGLVNYWHSGQFRIMPWQGPFTFYIANASKNANGKYFTQTVYIPEREHWQNPARLESEALYLQNTNKFKINSIDEFNNYWKQLTREKIAANPVKWLKLTARKAYYYFHNFEQYNNKTYSFHKSLSPVLRYNPLGWGLLLILAVLALAGNRLPGRNGKTVIFAFLIMAASTIIFLVSGRFRLLSVPMLIAIAAGITNMKLGRLFTGKNMAIALVVAAIVFPNFFKVADTSTLVSDYLLMAQSNARLFNFQQQYAWADKATKAHPENLNAIRLKIVAFINLVLEEQITDETYWKLVARELDFLNAERKVFSDTTFASGCYAYKHLGDKEKAFEFWQYGLENLAQTELYLAALLLTDKIKPSDKLLEFAESPLMWYALVEKGALENDDPEKFAKYKRIAHFLLF